MKQVAGSKGALVAMSSEKCTGLSDHYVVHLKVLGHRILTITGIISKTGQWGQYLPSSKGEGLQVKSMFFAK